MDAVGPQNAPGTAGFTTYDPDYDPKSRTYLGFDGQRHPCP
jgi:hypothetical protein